MFHDHIFYAFYVSVIRIWVFEQFDTAVGMAARYWLGNPGIESLWGRDILQPSKPALRPTYPSIQCVLPLNTCPLLARGLNKEGCFFMASYRWILPLYKLVSTSTQKFSSVDRIWASILDAVISDLSYGTFVLNIFCGFVHHEGEFSNPSISRG
jgi:hypothetical protein